MARNYVLQDPAQTGKASEMLAEAPETLPKPRPQFSLRGLVFHLGIFVAWVFPLSIIFSAVVFLD